MGALLHHRGQRLRAAADGALSRPPRGGAQGDRRWRAGLPHALGRWPHHGRDRLPLPDPARRIRSRRRRDLLRAHRPRMRARSRALLRYGRNDGEGLPDRRFPAADREELRGRARRALPQGLGPAALDPGDRDGGDRRRRRQPRSGGRDGAHRGGAGERGRGSGPGLLWARRHPPGRDGCEPAARPLRPRALRRRQAAARPRGRRRGGEPGDCRAARDRPRDRRPRRRRDGGREHGECGARACDRVRQKLRRPHAHRLRRRRAGTRLPARREARHKPRPRACGGRRRQRDRLFARAGRLRAGTQPLPAPLLLR